METAQCISGERTIITVLGDITLLTCDVIVNAANEDLDHRGGLAKVIVDRGMFFVCLMVMVFNTTFNNISVIS
jgi:hypothetical protein